ncbi:MAG: hypothetical protein K2J33_07990 [Alistipes sp.]|nr:hypothetical protein [Alistipes sp.]
MKKRLSAIFAICAVLAVSCGDDVEPLDPNGFGGGMTDPEKSELVNASFEEGMNGWERVGDAAGQKATVEIVDGQGVQNGRCLKIQQLPENGKCYAGVKQTVTGLEPYTAYRLSARVRYSDIPEGEGCGACVFPIATEQLWNNSRCTYGTKLSDWSTVYCDFVSEVDGTAQIVCALGFWQGGRGNGGKSTGTVYFDNVGLRKVTDELFMAEGEHVRLFLEASKVAVPSSKIKQWLADLDRMYLSYEELVGGVPFDGKKVGIITTSGLEYWAVAGNPIVWNVNYVESALSELAEHDSWCFGLMHEIGHTFNIKNSNWNWNDEMFANFRMHYGLEMNGGQVWQNGKLYVGGDIINMYREAYEKTIATQVSDDGIHYMLARVAGQIGWEPFRKTFAYLNTRGGQGSNNFDKFIYFCSTLSRFATEIHGREIDVRNDYFTDAEIASIRKQLQ